MNNLRRIDLNLLVILETLLAERHISRAAERLHMSQPAVSHALGRRRQLFDDPLLLRGAQGMVPTLRALELSRPLAEALRQVHVVLGPAAFDPATAERTFRLGMSDYGAAAVLPRLIQVMRLEAPSIELHVSQHSREAMAAKVADSELDLALGVFPQLPDGVRWRRCSRSSSLARSTGLAWPNSGTGIWTPISPDRMRWSRCAPTASTRSTGPWPPVVPGAISP
ncbi:LysR family transcriptional regulator [Crenobacter sp. SG2305]|uniref:LysR family transcriptional regulator n=1 Tax=Crenobacter oryzisoli TaxID=3056844 RepID=UPI0025AAA708|nr:LysR family transcriptional regulator [Crenobacter sp. SG2305]MDN0085072.1 LysR family transcriptional regulator [Crenobacter sp. SG2305]